MNRAGVSLVRDRGPAAPAQDEIGWPPFLMRKDLSYSPTPGQVTPQRELLLVLQTFAPIPHRSIYSSLSLLLKLNLLLLLHHCNTWSAKVLLPWWRRNATVFLIQGSLDLFSWPPAQGPHERLLPRETAEWKQSQEIFHMIYSFKSFYCAEAPQSMCICFHKHTENHTCL